VSLGAGAWVGAATPNLGQDLNRRFLNPGARRAEPNPSDPRIHPLTGPFHGPSICIPPTPIPNCPLGKGVA